MKKRKYGMDVYIIAALIIFVHLAVIICKFMGKDVGVTIPDSLTAIQRQVEQASLAYMIFRNQRQVNNAHQRVSKIRPGVVA